MEKIVNCIIFGGGGFLGSHLTEKFLEKGYDVTAFDKPDAPFLDELRMKGANILKGDFFNNSDLDNVLINKEILIHLVSTTVPKTSNEDPLFDIDTNLAGTIRLLELVRRYQIKKVIFASSGGTVYGIPKEIPIKENHPTNPICSYGIVKLAIEKYLQFYNHNYQTNYSILRMSNLFGERQSIGGVQGIVPTIIHRGLHNQVINIYGDGSIIRDYLYVEDACEAFVKAAYVEGIHKTFNIGSGQGHSINEIIKLIEGLLETTLKIKFNQSRSLDVPSNVLDINRAKKDLDWQPKINLTNGLIKTIKYYSQENFISSNTQS